MRTHFLNWMTLGFVLVLVVTGCAGNPTPPPVDSMGTLESRLAISMLTGTASASSPTPSLTLTPMPTESPAITPTLGPIKAPTVLNFAGCWYGPGPTYTLESNISKGKRVELLGVGSVSGWYIIRNPYFHLPCWIAAANLELDPRMNISPYPVMTPGPPN